MMTHIPAKKDVCLDISWHKSTELQKATSDFHDRRARTPESLKAARTMHTEIIQEIFGDFQRKEICNRLEFTGSAYEGVQVAKSEGNDDLEFDVMMVLKLPKSYKLKSDSIQDKAGFSLIRYWESSPVSRCWLSEYCLSTEEEHCFGSEEHRLVDASKTVNGFFGKLQEWINESPKYKDRILLRRHGPAVQMDVYKDRVTSDPPYYCVDVVPAVEIQKPCDTRLYVAKPLKNRGMPDSVTWRQLSSTETMFRKRYSDTRVNEYTPSHIKCMQVFEDMLNTKYHFSLIGHSIDTDNGNDLEFKVRVVDRSHSRELQLDQVLEKPEFYWIVLKKNQPITSRLNTLLKTCYRPSGMHLDSRRATTVFEDELQDCIEKSPLLNGKVHVRRDGPVVRLLICEALKTLTLEGVQRSRSRLTPLYYVDLIFAYEINGDLYTARPKEEKNLRDAKAWRRSFSLEEKNELYGNYGCLKKVLRVLKVLRNAEVGLAQLTSYHLKTVFFWLKCNCDWKDIYIGERLVNVIGKLERCLEDKNLPHFFLKDLNLTSGMINDCIFHMQSRLFRLYTDKRSMLAVLGVPWYNPSITQSVEVINEKVTPTPIAVVESRDLSSAIRSEIKRLFCNLRITTTLESSRFPLNEYTVVINDDDEDANFYAMVAINDRRNELQTQEIQSASFQARPNYYRLSPRNTAASDPNLRRNLTGNCLDTTKTASFVADLMADRIASTAQLRGRVSVRLEGTVVKLRISQSSLNLPDFVVVPAYKAEDKLFVAADWKCDSVAWRQSHFVEEQSKILQAGCGLRVLRILKFLQRQESGLSGLTVKHMRAALLWELHEEPDWAESRMAERLLDVMNRLYFGVKVNCLKDYFRSDDNVLSDVSPRSLQDLRRYLSKFCENEDEQVRVLRSQAFYGGVSQRELVDQWKI